MVAVHKPVFSDVGKLKLILKLLLIKPHRLLLGKKKLRLPWASCVDPYAGLVYWCQQGHTPAWFKSCFLSVLNVVTLRRVACHWAEGGKGGEGGRVPRASRSYFCFSGKKLNN